ncbi:MAG: ATP-grasp domain-containing protein [Candidatus Saccharibacteria bacterium]
MHKYIFIVGKPDPFSASAHAIREAGFSVGVFLDKLVTLKNPSDYDAVVPVDFSDPVSLDTLAIPDLSIAGLVCTYENYILAKARLAEKLQLPGISPESALLCTDKMLMRQAFADYDESLSPAFGEIASVEEATRFAQAHGFPVIIKPANLVKSLLVIRCDDREQLEASTRYALSQLHGLYKQYRVYGRAPRLIIEQFMEGQLYSVAAFAGSDGQATICPGVAALTNAAQAGFDDNFLYRRALPAHIDEQLQDRLFEAARRGMAALKLRSSPAHVELIHTTQNTIKIIEIGARIGGYRPRMYRLSYGMDLAAMEVANAASEPLIDTQAPLKGYTAVYELFPHTTGAFDALVPAEHVRIVAKRVHSLNIKAKRGAKCGPAKDGYKATAVVIVQDADYTEFMAKCAEVERLQVALL